MAMRTLTLLVALLLLAFETRAEPFEGSAEELLDQDLLGEDDQDMSISFGGDERTALQYADVRSRVTCYCRRGGCGSRESHIGYCRYRNIIYRLCCRR
ncbi:Neutrophil antibiotic peptide NP-1 [Cricetulus griseus]|uniref:Neutrophil antibiotic peptide NP-1 n=2 Tax=Cricetulus griseus TaxID=10029 RepID=G3HBA9_CRIGR|nr:Neutrophil antibiotic peptide NP-1 [Cricetulus griseus]